MIKDHSESNREKPLLPLHELLFAISSKGSIHHKQDSRYHGLFIPVVEHWLE